MSQPNIAITNLGNLYLQGCQLFYSSATAFFVAPGQARNSTNVNDIVVPGLLDISTTVLGPGGLDQGTIAANTLYAVYVLGQSGSSSYNAVMSASFGQPLLDGQYNMYRRVGCVATNGSGNVIKFFQTGNSLDRYMWYDSSVQVVSTGGTSSYQAINLESLVPQLPNGCETLISAFFGVGISASVLYLRPTGSSSNYGYTQGTVDASNVNYFSLSCPVSNVASLDYSVSVLSASVNIFIAGYIDSL